MNGIRIVDFSRVLAGPYATQQLADQGAEVIKVEPPGGDETRHFGPLVKGVSTYFLSINRNKRSIILDLKQPQAQQVALKLIESADVVFENYRPGVAKRLGIDWQRARSVNPKLVYISIKAFGEQGDHAATSRAGYDLVLQAMGGGAAITGQPGQPPSKHGNSIADLTTGLLAAQAALSGLLHRERTGQGQRIVVNMMQLQSNLLAHHLTRQLIAGEPAEQRGNSHAALVPYDLYPCSDGWLAIACGNDRLFVQLCKALNISARTEWQSNPQRLQHRQAIDQAIARQLQQLTVARADDTLTAAGVPCGPVLTPEQTLSHPAVRTVRVQHDTLGAIELPGVGFASLSTRQQHTAPPAAGEHQRAILEELDCSECLDEAVTLADNPQTP